MVNGSFLLRGSIALIAIVTYACTARSGDKVAVKVVLNAENVVAGEPVWIIFSLFNETGEALELAVRDDEPADLRLIVTDSLGRPVDPPARFEKRTCALWYAEIVEPGESFERGVLLSQRFRLDKPGEYVIRARYPHRRPTAPHQRLPRSEEFTMRLHVAPEDPGRLRAVGSELMEVACAESAEPPAARLAARALTSIDDPLVQPYLKRLLKCGDFLVRLIGVTALQRERSPGSIETLISAAEGPDPLLAAIARGALDSLVEGAAINALPPELPARAYAVVGKEEIQ